MIELEDVDTLAQETVASWPQEIVGKRVSTWVVTPGLTEHATRTDAILHVEQQVRHPIQWHEPFPDRDPSPVIFAAHPRVIALWETIGHLQPGCGTPFHNREQDQEHDRLWAELHAEIGDSAYEQWTVSPEYEAISAPIVDAVLPHPFSRFFARPRPSGQWEVWEFDPFSNESKHFRHADTLKEALAEATRADYNRKMQSGAGMVDDTKSIHIKKETLLIAAILIAIALFATVLP